MTLSSSKYLFDVDGGQTGFGTGKPAPVYTPTVRFPARCIADVKADTYHTSFLAGTLSLKEENEVHLIRLSSGGTELVCESYEADVWQIPEQYGQSNSPQLECIASLDAHSSKIKCVLWWPSGRYDKLNNIDEQNIFLWSLDSSKKSAHVQSQEFGGMLHHMSGGAWDPLDLNVVAYMNETDQAIERSNQFFNKQLSVLIVFQKGFRSEDQCHSYGNKIVDLTYKPKFEIVKP
ncbi:hypothetical protein L2E82_20248 [Cichorium intybus]|uniref:Uncharacterized protein n=1 Tax=Cichorium intybus TaxID=13427 RepID=A0ACB9DSG5_CICIN|nr:hypothetical protein L2E82_20248 [Cichorium intybus]